MKLPQISFKYLIQLSLIWLATFGIVTMLPILFLFFSIQASLLLETIWFVLYGLTAVSLPALSAIAIWNLPKRNLRTALLQTGALLVGCLCLGFICFIFLSLRQFGGPTQWQRLACQTTHETYYVKTSGVWNDDGCHDDQWYELFKPGVFIFRSIGRTTLYTNSTQTCGSRDVTSPETSILIADYTYTPATKELRCGQNIRRNTTSSTYVEYPFDSGKDQDLGFTYRALKRLQAQTRLLSTDSKIVEFPTMRFISITEQDRLAGIIEKTEVAGDQYTLGHPLNADSSLYEVQKNGRPLFQTKMAVAADGPILEQRLIDNEPAFTFTSHCSVNAENAVICQTDSWYRGSLLSEQFGVQNPRYPFVYKGKIGFVASDQGRDRIFYDGAFVTPAFDEIWIHNCCSYTEILPTLYENGTLLFYAKRQSQTYLVEVSLR